MSTIAAHDRERRYELGYSRRGNLRGQKNKFVRTPSFFKSALETLGHHHCALRHSPGHACSGRLVVDHNHSCSEGHSGNNACVRCVRGILCASGNLLLAAWDREYRARGGTYIPPEVLDYMEGRPLV